MNFLAAIGKGITLVNRKIAMAASLLIFPLVGIMCVEVFRRYFLGSPSIYAFDLQWMICGSMIFLGGAYCLAENVHVRADILYNMLKRRWQLIIDIVLYPVFFFTACAALTYSSWVLFYNAYTLGEASRMTSWGPVMWPSRLVLFTSFCMLSIQGVVKFITLLVTAPAEIKAEEAAAAAKKLAAKAEVEAAEAETPKAEVEVAEAEADAAGGGDETS